MDLTVDFICPRCFAVHALKVSDLAPGQARLCRICHQPLELTPISLQALARDLPSYCNS